MKKMGVCFFLLFSFLLLLGSQNSTVPKQQQFSYIEQDGFIKISKYLDNSIEIPEIICGKTVTAIDVEAFYQFKNITSITLPQTLCSIGHGAFYRCYSLEEIEIPKSVTQIGSNPFFRCISLKQITVERENPCFSAKNGVLYNKAGSVLLAYPEGKEDECFVIPASVTKIDDSAFGYHALVKNITIPKTVKEFPKYNIFLYPDEITLYVAPGSAAQQYAEKYAIKYKWIQ